MKKSKDMSTGKSHGQFIKNRRSVLIALSAAIVFVTTYILILPAITLDQESASEQGGIDVPAAEQQLQDVSQSQEDPASDSEPASEPASKPAAESASDRSAEPAAGQLLYEGKGYTVETAFGKKAGLPENTILSADEITENDEDYSGWRDEALKAVREARGGEQITDLTFARFYDIVLESDGEQLEPKAQVEVTISYDDALKVEDVKDLRVIHFAAEKDGSIKSEILDSKKIKATVKNGEMTRTAFRADSFSMYAVVYVAGTEETGEAEKKEAAGNTEEASEGEAGESEETRPEDAEAVKPEKKTTREQSETIKGGGEDYEIAVTYDEKAEIPDGAKLKIKEIDKDSKKFKEYLSDSADKLGVNNNEVSFARFFDIRIVKGLRKIEPKAPVQIEISYSKAVKVSKGQNLNVVHFADKETEVISTCSLSDNQKEISYEQNSFSVTGTIVSNIEQNGQYAVIIKHNDAYYAVENDGSLMAVNYTESSNSVDMDYPIFWTYAVENVSSSVTGGYSGPVTNLRIPTLASGFNSQQLPSGYYYRYINPNDSNGITEEEYQGGTTEADKARADAAHPGYVWKSAIRYENNHIQCFSNYIGVDPENMKIKGNVSESEAAEVYLARVTSVPPSANLNHTVNHIDISIEGGASFSVPLAYGDYYYYVDGQKRTLSVRRDNDVTLELKKDKVDINADDMKKAEITAFSKRTGKVMNNAFYITGYSQNQENGISTSQVRLEGSFLVSDLQPYTNTTENWLSEQQLKARLDNRVYYTVTAKKELTFDWEYTYEDGKKAQLYDADGNPLSSTVMVNLSKSFDYWDPDNECPPVTWDRNTWSKGHIIWDTSHHDGTGMDFKLTAFDQQTSDHVAIEIEKKLMTDSGETLQPKKEVTNQFVVYQKKPAQQADIDGVADVGVGDSDAQADYSGYSGTHAKTVTVGQSGDGLVYDYDVEPGMVYVAEDEDSIDQTITDMNGVKWNYVRSYIETDHAWRDYGDEGKIHHAAGLIAVPEVLGNYGTYHDTDTDTDKPLVNGFEAFHVYNIYEREDETVTLPVSKTWSDFAESDYKWTAQFQLQYIERKIDGDGPDDSVTEWTNYTPENILTIHKDAVSQQTVHSTFGDLPKYVERGGNKYERQYSAHELGFTVWKVEGGEDRLLYSYDGTDYVIGEGADETIYKVFYEHDANENWDGDWNLRINNSAAEKIEPRHIDIGLEKDWQPEIPDNASAKFVLKRYIQTEYVDYGSNLENDTVTVQLQDADGSVLNSIETKSGMNVYLAATFAEGRTGTLSFACGSDTYNLTNDTVSEQKTIIRSGPIPVAGEEGDIIIIKLTSGDPEHLLADGVSGMQVTDRMEGTAPRPDDSFSREITFPIEGKTGAEAWQYTFEDLIAEDGEWDTSGTLANFNIYSYYLEETEASPDGARVSIKDSRGNSVSAGNRLYMGDDVTATNTFVGDHIHIEKRWYRLLASQMPPVVIRVRQTVNNVTSDIRQDAYDADGNIVRYNNTYGGYVLDVTNGWAIDIDKLRGNIRRDFQEIGFIDGGDPENGYASGRLMQIPTGGTGYDSKHYYFSADGTPPNETEHDALVGQITTNGGDNIYATNGTMFIYNVPNYIGYQVEVHKKWLAFNGSTGLSDITDHYGTSEGTGLIMQLQQRARWNGTTTVASDWMDYGKPFEIYIDHNTADQNGFEQVMQGTWLTTVDEKNLSRYGYLYNENNGDYETVEYDYRFVEVGVIEGNDGRLWSKSTASANDPDAGGDHRYRIENFEVGQIELRKQWKLEDASKKASEVYFKIYSDWWFSSYNAQPNEDGKYDVADIIGRDINDPSLSPEEKAIYEQYWLKNGITVKQVGDLGYVFTVAGTGDQWTGGLVRGLPLLKADPNSADDPGNNNYGEVLYTAEEVGAWYDGRLVKVGTESWPYVDPQYYRNVRNQGENSVDNGTTFQIDNGTVDYSSYFKAVNSDVPTWKFHADKSWDQLPDKGAEVVLELQALKLTPEVLEQLQKTAEQEEDGIKVSNLTQEQTNTLVGLSDGWYTADIDRPSVVLPRNWDYTSMPETTEEEIAAKQAAATKAWSIDWTGAPVYWKNDDAADPQKYELFYRVVETSSPVWTAHTVNDLTIGENFSLSQSVDNTAVEDSTGELEITKKWNGSADPDKWPQGYVVNYKVIQHAFLADVEEVSETSTYIEDGQERTKTVKSLSYKADKDKPLFDVDNYREGVIEKDQNPVTLKNLPKGQMWTAPDSEDDLTEEMIAAGIRAGKTYSIAYAYEVVETGVSAGTQTLPFAATSGDLDVNTESTGTLENETTEVTVEKQWEKDGESIEWPSGYTVGYKIIREISIDGTKVGEEAVYTSDAATALSEQNPERTVSDLPKNGIWIATAPAEDDAWKSSYNEMELVAGEQYRASYSYRVEEATQASEGSVKPNDSDFSFDPIRAVFDKDAEKYIITNDLTEIKVVKEWSGYTPKSGDKVGVKLYVSTTAPGITEKIDVTVQMNWATGTVAPETFSVPAVITGVDSKGETVETRNITLTQDQPFVVESLEKYDDYDEPITYKVTLDGEATGELTDVSVGEHDTVSGENGKVDIDATGVQPKNTGSITIENVDFEGTITVAQVDGGGKQLSDWTTTSITKGATAVLSELKPGDKYFVKLSGFQESGTNPVSSFPENVQYWNWGGDHGYTITATETDTKITLKAKEKVQVTINVEAYGEYAAGGSRSGWSFSSLSPNYNDDQGFSPNTLDVNNPAATTVKGWDKEVSVSWPQLRFEGLENLNDVHWSSTLPSFTADGGHHWGNTNGYFVVSANSGTDSTATITIILGDKPSAASRALSKAKSKFQALKALPLRGSETGATGNVTVITLPDGAAPGQDATVTGKTGLPHGATCLTETEIELSAEVDATTNEAWSHLWKDLPKTDAEGNTLYYYVVETSATVSGSAVKATYDRTEATETEPTTVTITNEVEDDQKYGSLEVSKKLSGVTTENWKTKAYKFTLQNSQGKYLNASTYEWQDNAEGAEFEVSEDNAIRFDHLPVGNYIITETSTGEELAIEAYEYDEINSVKGTTGEGISVTETSTPDAPVSFKLENKYIPKKTSVMVTKAWLNSDGSEAAPEDAEVTFELYRSGTEKPIASIALDGQTDENGETAAWVASWTDLPAYSDTEEEYTYTVKEVTTDGYSWSHYTVRYPEDGTTHQEKEYASDQETITNIEAEIPVKILKRDADTEEPLTGAKFRILKKNSSDEYEVFSAKGIDSNGEFTIDSDSGILLTLTSGEYKVEEIGAPAGYIITDGSTFFFKIENGDVIYTDASGAEISDDSELLVKCTRKTDTEPATFTVGNTPGAELPSSGGPGTTWIYLLGMILFIGCSILLIARRRVTGKGFKA